MDRSDRFGKVKVPYTERCDQCGKITKNGNIIGIVGKASFCSWSCHNEYKEENEEEYYTGIGGRCDYCNHKNSKIYFKTADIDYDPDGLLRFCSPDCHDKYSEEHKEYRKSYSIENKIRDKEAKKSESSGCGAIIIFLIIVPIFMQIIAKGCRAIF
jgi:hypothetical protein